MATPVLQNPFDFGFVDEVMPSTEKAVASYVPQRDAAAASLPATDFLGSNISDVGEIFHFARMLCAEARIRPGSISADAVAIAEEIRAYETVYRDPPPLFLRASA